MATTNDYIEFVCEKIQRDYSVRYKKMFGEYMVYINEKPIILVCDNTVYVKELKEIFSLMKNSIRGIPYNGAKEHYILDIEDIKLTEKVIKVLEEITPLPKKKKTNKI